MLLKVPALAKAIGFALLLANLTVAASYAVLLTPGNTVLALPSIAGLGATKIADETVPFSTATFSGTLESTVWSDDATNKLGGLTFAYFLTNDEQSSDDIERLALSSFHGFKTDVSFVLWYPGHDPTLVDRSHNGNVVAFDFPPKLFGLIGPGPLEPGETTRALVIRTNAHSYYDGQATISDSLSTTISAFAPVGIAVVPEPASLALAIVGALGAAWAVRQRRKV